MVDLERESDIERLRQVALLQRAELKRLISALAHKCAELERFKVSETGELQRTLALLEAARQEEAAVARAASAAGTGGDDDAPAEAEGQRRRKPQRGHGPTEQPALERVKLVCELDEADKACRSCGGELKPLPGEAETSEMIDVVDIKYVLTEVERKKYVCKCGSVVETAPGPERAIDGGRYSLRFAIKVAFDKYVTHLPLERQARVMGHYGLDISSQTLWDQCSAVTKLLEPTYEAIFGAIRASPVIGVDQTGWPDLEDKDLPPWQMWCLTAPGLVYHRICDDKSAATFKDLLDDYKGVVVCDAASTHAAGARGKSDIQLAGCWAHAYRRVTEAESDFPTAIMLRGLIQDLYRIDARATSDEDRARLRATESVAVLANINTWIHEQRALPTTTLGKAIRYIAHNWDRLTLFATHPLIWLDNNATERGLRGPVVGRRNHFGSKSARGTEVAAVLYTLVESAKVAKVDPIAYLVEVATRTKRTPGAVLLPAHFKPTN